MKTPEKIGQLAVDMIDSWDNKDLYNFALDMVTEKLEKYNEEEFQAEWDDYYGEDA